MFLVPPTRPASIRLVAIRFTSHSNGATIVSSKSLMSNTSRPSGAANAPRFRTCASPHSWLHIPVFAVSDRSYAITGPRRESTQTATPPSTRSSGPPAPAPAPASTPPAASADSPAVLRVPRLVLHTPHLLAPFLPKSVPFLRVHKLRRSHRSSQQSRSETYNLRFFPATNHRFILRIYKKPRAVQEAPRSNCWHKSPPIGRRRS